MNRKKESTARINPEVRDYRKKSKMLVKILAAYFLWGMNGTV